MRKQYLTYITPLASAALMLMAASCSHAEPASEEGGLSGLDQMEVPMVMSVLPETNPGAGDYDHGTQPTDLIARAECAINPADLYIGTFTPDGELIDVLYNGGIPGNGNPTGTVFFDHATWGPTISFTLNKETHNEYNSDFYIAAFAVPEIDDNPAFDITRNTLTEPGLTFPSALVGKTWTEEDITNLGNGTSHAFIPMAGCQLITNTWLEATYNRDIYGVAPLQLPSILMTRAVAKIVIEDLDGIIISATCKYNSKGNLFPHTIDNHPGKFGWWSKEFQDTPPAIPNIPLSLTESDKSTPTLTSANASRQNETDDTKTVNQFIFYAFEHDFKEKDATASERGLITLTANGLPDKTIYIAPYTNGGKELTGNDATYASLADRDNGAWTGLLRNHCYTYSVSKPANGEMQIYVKATKWEYERITFDF